MSGCCSWGDYVPRGENARGVDSGKVKRAGSGWLCSHGARPGKDFCMFHERVAARYSMILDWAVYQLSRRRDSFSGHAYDWSVRKDVNNLSTEELSKALELIVADRARDGAKKGIVEVSDLVRAIAAIQRDQRREGGEARGNCSKCLGTGWAAVWDRYDDKRTAVACCTCNAGRSRSAEAATRGSPVPTIGRLPERWTTIDPLLIQVEQMGELR